jgi:hypothetical protein
MISETVFAASFSTPVAVVGTEAGSLATAAFAASFSMPVAVVGTDAGSLAVGVETAEEVAASSCEARAWASVRAASACCSAVPVVKGSERAVAGTARTPHAITATRAQMRTQP